MNNLTQIDRAAHMMNHELKRSHVSCVSDEPKKLATSSIWEDVKRRRKSGDPLMKGGHSHEHEYQYRDVLKGDVLYSQSKT